MNPLINAMANNWQPQYAPPNQNGSFMDKLQQFSSMVQGNPRDIVMNLVNSGRMSQQQFQQYAMMANQFTGRG